MPHRSLSKFAIVVMGMQSIAALASEPATQPVAFETPVATDAPAVAPAEISPPSDSVSAASDDDRPRHPDRGEAAPLGRARFNQRYFGPITPKDISDSLIYLKEHSPNRAAAIDSLPDGPRKNNVMDLAARNYVSWMRMLNQDPQLYKVIVQRVEVEDVIFGLVTQLRKQSPDAQQATQSKLRDQVSKLVDLGIQERQIRLQRLEQTVEQLKDKLEDDSVHRSNLVDQRLKTILSDGKGLFPNTAGHTPHPADDVH